MLSLMSSAQPHNSFRASNFGAQFRGFWPLAPPLRLAPAPGRRHPSSRGCGIAVLKHRTARAFARCTRAAPQTVARGAVKSCQYRLTNWAGRRAERLWWWAAPATTARLPAPRRRDGRGHLRAGAARGVAREECLLFRWRRGRRATSWTTGRGGRSGAVPQPFIYRSPFRPRAPQVHWNMMGLPLLPRGCRPMVHPAAHAVGFRFLSEMPQQQQQAQ